MKNVIKNGNKIPMAYEDICKELGFNAACNFVVVTSRGTITFSAGKPDEIRALYAAIIDNGYVASSKLARLATSQL